MVGEFFQGTNLRQRAVLLVLMYLVALTARVAAGLVVGMSGPLCHDEPEYYGPAVSMAEGYGYCKVEDGRARPTAYRVPGPMLILAGCFTVFEPSVALARWVSVIVASFSAPLMYLFASSIGGRTVSIVSGLACALYPTWVYYALGVYSESYFVPALLLALLLTVHALRLGGNRMWLAAGMGFGIAALMRPHAIPIAALVCLYLAWSVAWRRATLVLLGTAAVVAPWTIRNQLVFGRFVLLATEGGETLLGSNNPYVLESEELHGMWIYTQLIPEYRAQLREIEDELQRNDMLNAMAIAYWKQNPQAIPSLVFHKLWRWLTPFTATRGSVRVLVLSSYGVLLALLLAGTLGRIIRASVPLYLVMLSTLALSVIVAVYWGGLTRGRVVVEVIWIPWAVWTACWIGRSIRERIRVGAISMKLALPGRQVAGAR